MSDNTVTPPEKAKAEQPSQETLEATQKALEGAKKEVDILSGIRTKLQELMVKLNTMKPEEKVVAFGGLFVPILLKWILGAKEEEAKKESAEVKETPKKKQKKKKKKKKKKADAEEDETAEDETDEDQEDSSAEDDDTPKMRATTKKPPNTKRLIDSEVSDKLKAEAVKFQKEASGKPQGTKKEVTIDGKTYVLQREVHYNRNPKGALGTSAYEKKA